MKIGKIVDAIICGEALPVQVKVLKKDYPDLYETQKDMDPDLLCTEEQMATGVQLAMELRSSPVFDWWTAHDTEFQRVLTSECEGVPVCGMLDELTFDLDNLTIYIDDTKCSNEFAVSSVYNWARHCEEFGYFRQLAHYRQLVIDTWAKDDERLKVVCRHNVLVKINDYVAKVVTYEIASEVLDQAYEEFKAIVREIRDTKVFVDEKGSWEKAEVITLNDLPRRAKTNSSWDNNATPL